MAVKSTCRRTVQHNDRWVGRIPSGQPPLAATRGGISHWLSHFRDGKVHGLKADEENWHGNGSGTAASATVHAVRQGRGRQDRRRRLPGGGKPDRSGARGFAEFAAGNGPC